MSQITVGVVGKILLWCFAIAIVARSAGADEATLRLFAVPFPKLRSPEMERAAGAPSVETFSLQTGGDSVPLEARVQRHQGMNGASPLRRQSVQPVAGFQRTVEFLLPKKGSLLQRNPNLRRNPLVVEGW